MAWSGYTNTPPWQNRSTKSVYQIQSPGASAPTDPTDGLNLESIAGFTLYATCDSGQSFNSAATMLKAYRYDPYVGIWARAAELDITIGSEPLTLRSIATAFSVSSPRGSIAHIWDGTGVSGGNLTISYTVSMLTGDRT